MTEAATDPNPFRPGFGRPPQVVVGRAEIIDGIREAFDAEWHPARKTYLRAMRGSGKTVLLNEIQDAASDRGWLVIEENAGSRAAPLVERIQARLWQYIDHAQPPARRRSTGGQVGVAGVSVGASWQPNDRQPLRTLRDDLERVLDLGEHAPAGVLLSIDEIHEATRDEIAEIANAIQHLDRAERPIAIALAGLPLNGADEPTFLGRCERPALDIVDDAEIERGLRETAAIGGRSFTPDALKLAVAHTAGFPYMMQLVGRESYRNATSHDGDITTADVVAGVPAAARQLGQAVLAPVERRLTPAEHDFLVAMAVDNGPSRMADLIERLGKTKQYVNLYRLRLLDAGLIHQAGRGHLDFVAPGHRSFIRSAQPTTIAELRERQRPIESGTSATIEPPRSR